MLSGGAVAGDVLGPLFPIILIATLKVNTTAQNCACGLRRQPLNKRRHHRMKNAAVVRVVVFSWFAGIIRSA